MSTNYKESRVEICEDMSCVIFNENGYAIQELVREVTPNYPISRLHGCVLEELEIRETGELFSNLFIGKAWKKESCDKWSLNVGNVV